MQHSQFLLSTVISCSQITLQTRKRRLFEIESFLNDPFEPRLYALLAVQTCKKRHARGKCRRQRDARGFGSADLDRFPPGSVVVRLGDNDLVNVSFR
jgi:hypothetical protein